MKLITRSLAEQMQRITIQISMRDNETMKVFGGRLWIGPSKGRGMWSNDQSMKAGSGSRIHSHGGTIAKGIRLALISSPLSFKQLFPRHLFIISSNVHCICETMPNRGSRPKQTCAPEQRRIRSLNWTVFQACTGQTSLVNARVSSVPCNWYNVKKLFSDRPGKTYGPSLWVSLKENSCILLLKPSANSTWQPDSQSRVLYPTHAA